MSIYRLTGSRELNVKAVVAAFNQEKALVGAFSVITNLRMDLFEAQSQVWGRTISTGLPLLCIIYSEQYVECGGGGGVLIEQGGALLH